MPDFILLGLSAGLIITTITGPLGAFVVWQRLSYFGDTLAHAALLGIALNLWFSIHHQVAILISCLSLAALLVFLQRNPRLATDSLLGILSHGSLAFGLLAVSFIEHRRIDLNSYLFGDLLAVNTSDLVIITGMTALIGVLLIRFWRGLLNITVHQELAEVEGFAVTRLRLLLMLMIASVVAIAIKVVGILLITALLIIPAVAASRLAKSPEQTALIAVVIGWLSISCGLWLSIETNAPVGPSIVAVATVLFVVSLTYLRALKQWFLVRKN